MGEIVDRRTLAERIRQDRAASLTIAFANGGFDLLHVGHVRYLEGAKREADRLHRRVFRAAHSVSGPSTCE